MFCSNQKCVICGDTSNTKALNKVLDLVCSGYLFYPKFYRIGDDGYLYFYKYMFDKKDNVIEISEEDRTIEFYFSIIQMYFNSFKYRDTLKNRTENECAGLDGSSHAGWLLVLDNSGMDDIVIIKPYWCFYHK